MRNSLADGRLHRTERRGCQTFCKEFKAVVRQLVGCAKASGQSVLTLLLWRRHHRPESTTSSGRETNERIEFAELSPVLQHSSTRKFEVVRSDDVILVKWPRPSVCISSVGSEQDAWIRKLNRNHYWMPSC
jgi:hypothetical protein